MGKRFIGITAITVATVAATGVFCTPVTTAIAAPAVSAPAGSLASVSALSANYVFAVGCEPATYRCPITGRDVSYLWHNGVWEKKAVPMPALTNQSDVQSGQLNGVKVISTSNAWAVGWTMANGAQIVHWNGIRWRQITPPSLPSNIQRFYQLYSVSASSASNVWAVGESAKGTVTLHYNGKAWAYVPSPSFGTTFLFGVVTTSATNAWAVGTDTTTTCGCDKVLIIHWNGTAWKVQMNALGASADSTFHAVAATSSANAWAAGDSSHTTDTMLTDHWDGTSWQRVTSGQGRSSSTVFGIAAISAGNVWAVGNTATPIHHLSGGTWHASAGAKVPSSGPPTLEGVAGMPAGSLWAVGYYTGAGGLPQMLIEHWNGTSWTAQMG